MADGPLSHSPVYIYTRGHLSTGWCGQTSIKLQNLREAIHVHELAIVWYNIVSRRPTQKRGSGETVYKQVFS